MHYEPALCVVFRTAFINIERQKSDAITAHVTQRASRRETRTACSHSHTILCTVWPFIVLVMAHRTSIIYRVDFFYFLSYYFFLDFLQSHASQCEPMCAIAFIIVSSEMERKNTPRVPFVLVCFCSPYFGVVFVCGSAAHRTHSPINYITLNKRQKIEATKNLPTWVVRNTSVHNENTFILFGALHAAISNSWTEINYTFNRIHLNYIRWKCAPRRVPHPPAPRFTFTLPPHARWLFQRLRAIFPSISLPSPLSTSHNTCPTILSFFFFFLSFNKSKCLSIVIF